MSNKHKNGGKNSNSNSGSNSDSKSSSKSNSDITKISVDNLFPTEGNKSGARGKRLDINSLVSGSSIINEPDITFTSDILIERRKKRRVEKLNCYRQMLKYCHERIAHADDDLKTDIFFNIVENIPECKEYS